MVWGVTLFAVIIVVYGALAGTLGRWSVTAPMIFVAAGLLLSSLGLNVIQLSMQTEGIKQLTEITLALLLFADASTLSFRQVREDAMLPARLLTVGILLTIALGTITALILFPVEGLAFAALSGAILAPTDAALGLPIFNNPAVPARVRRALNVESGLNDGIATPIVTLFLAFAAATEAQARSGGWLPTALAEIGLAVLAGAGIGMAGGWLFRLAARRGWTESAALQVGTLALGLAAYLGSLALGGNGFIAAFVGGIAFGNVMGRQAVDLIEPTEDLGMILSILVWGIFGALFVPLALHYTTDWRPVLYAILSLTVIRMAPVALAMRGAGFRRDTVALMGWFGPRGLASVVFTLMAFLEFEHAGRPIDTLAATATWTILLSVFAHGLSAVPLSTWYARRLARAPQPLAETAVVADLPGRRGVRG